MVALPLETPVTSPESDTFTTESSELTHVTVLSVVLNQVICY